jgi:hypothetical protein
MRYSNQWHHLPSAVQDQARARWPKGKRAAGPGDWYLYDYEMVELTEIAPGYQLSCLPVLASSATSQRVPRLVGRKPVKPTRPVARCFADW